MRHGRLEGANGRLVVPHVGEQRLDPSSDLAARHVVRILQERRHVHVFRARMECKIWIENGIELAWNRGFAQSEINDILRMIEKNLGLIYETYERLFA